MVADGVLTVLSTRVANWRPQDSEAETNNGDNDDNDRR